MLLRQKVFTVMLSMGLIILIVDLVRRRRLREEYAWIWMLTGAVVLILAIWRDLLVFVTRWIGAELPANTIFFFGVFFLILINLYFSVKLSTVTDRLNKVIQELALLREKLENRSHRKQE